MNFRPSGGGLRNAGANFEEVVFASAVASNETEDFGLRGLR